MENKFIIFFIIILLGHSTHKVTRNNCNNVNINYIKSKERVDGCCKIYILRSRCVDDIIIIFRTYKIYVYIRIFIVRKTLFLYSFTFSCICTIRVPNVNCNVRGRLLYILTSSVINLTATLNQIKNFQVHEF